MSIFRHLKLEIALTIRASNEWKIEKKQFSSTHIIIHIDITVVILYYLFLIYYRSVLSCLQKELWMAFVRCVIRFRKVLQKPAQLRELEGFLRGEMYKEIESKWSCRP